MISLREEERRRHEIREEYITGHVPVYECIECTEPLFYQEEFAKIDGEPYCCDCAYKWLHSRISFIEEKDINDVM